MALSSDNNMTSIKETLQSQWNVKYKSAVQFDMWGQIVEAQDEYRNLVQTMAAKQGQIFITSSEKDMLHRLIMCLTAREEVLRTGNVSIDSITAADIKTLERIFETLFSPDAPSISDFTIPTYKFQSANPIQTSSEAEIVFCEKHESATDFYATHQAIRNVKGTVVSIKLDKIGLKDAQTYIDPLITILVVDQWGEILDQHDLPATTNRKPTYILFGNTIYLNKSLEDMNDTSASIFIEFKHFKPKKKKLSTKCWAFMELSELKPDEEIVLELYQKPTDLKKKKLKLYTEKQLYLHLFATFIRP